MSRHMDVVWVVNKEICDHSVNTFMQSNHSGTDEAELSSLPRPQCRSVLLSVSSHKGFSLLFFIFHRNIIIFDPSLFLFSNHSAQSPKRMK